MSSLLADELRRLATVITDNGVRLPDDLVAPIGAVSFRLHMLADQEDKKHEELVKFMNEWRFGKPSTNDKTNPEDNKTQDEES